MKKSTKSVLIALCAVLLMVTSVMATLAYLTDDETVVNTFTVGNVGITLHESVVDEYGVKTTGTTNEGNEYKLIPGHTYVKDPTITVASDSEKCYLFVKVENGLGADATIKMEEDWTQIGTTNYWYCNTIAQANDVVPAMERFTFGQQADPASYETAEIKVTAYAIQADGFDDVHKAWAALSDQLTLN